MIFYRLSIFLILIHLRASCSKEVDTISSTTREDRDGILDGIGETIVNIQEGLQSVGEKVDNIQEGLQSVGEKVENIQDGFQSVGEKVDNIQDQQDGFQSVGEKVENIQDGFQSMGEKIDNIQDSFQGVGEKVDNIQSGFQSAGEIVGNVQDVFQSVGEKVGNMTDSFQGVGEKVDNIQSGFQSAGEKVGNVQDVFQSVGEKVGNITDSFQSVGEKVENIQDGFQSVGDIAKLLGDVLGGHTADNDADNEDRLTTLFNLVVSKLLPVFNKAFRRNMINNYDPYLIQKEGSRQVGQAGVLGGACDVAMELNYKFNLLRGLSGLEVLSMLVEKGSPFLDFEIDQNIRGEPAQFGATIDTRLMIDDNITVSADMEGGLLASICGYELGQSVAGHTGFQGLHGRIKFRLSGFIDLWKADARITSIDIDEVDIAFVRILVGFNGEKIRDFALVQTLLDKFVDSQVSNNSDGEIMQLIEKALRSASQHAIVENLPFEFSLLN